MGSARFRVISICAAASLLALLVLLHVHYVNGPEHWQWLWRRVPAVRWYLAMLAGAAPVFAAVVVYHRNPRRVVLAIALLMLGTFTLKLASVAAVRPPTGMSLIADVVRSREATSYFIDAGALTNFPGWFAAYDEVLPRTGLHTRSKPPGPLLYWTAFIRLFGYTDRAAVVGGLVLGVLATLAIPATWCLAKLLTRDAEVAFIAAATLALCPGFVLFFPMLDPAYVVIACAMIGLWHLTIARGSAAHAILFGLTLVIAMMVAYPLLSLGFFLLFYGLFCAGRRVSEAVWATERWGAVAIAVFAGVYLALWFFTGYDPVATFRSAWANQHGFLAQHEADRRWPATITFDLLDFALGAGWLPVLVAIACLISTFNKNSPLRASRLLVVFCVAQPLVVALTGLVQSETARVWTLMLPLLLIPAAMELRSWTDRERLVVYACMWLLLAVVGQNMTFLNPG